MRMFQNSYTTVCLPEYEEIIHELTLTISSYGWPNHGRTIECNSNETWYGRERRPSSDWSDFGFGLHCLL